MRQANFRHATKDYGKSLALVTTGRTRIPDLRCRDVAALGRAPYTDWIGRLRSKDIEIVDNALKSVGMYEYADRTMDKMSDGECQRIMIARAIAQSTPVILLDEPTSFLDMPNRYELCSLLRSLAHNDGKCILFSTHELDIAMQMCDNIILLDNPTLYNLPPAQLAASGHIERLFRNNTVSIDGRTGKINLHLAYSKRIRPGIPSRIRFLLLCRLYQSFIVQFLGFIS